MLYDKDNKLKERTLKDIDKNKVVFKESFTYDSLERLKEENILNDVKSILKYSYKYGKNEKTGDSINHINKVRINDSEYNYIYDLKGNIAEVNSEAGKNIYKYDLMGQLIKEENLGRNSVAEFKYDTGGNILNKNIVTESGEKDIVYLYDDIWKDKLVSYDGKKIEYDQIGNPLSFDGATFTWESGRNLTKYIKDDLSVEYKYNKDGIRYSENVNGIETRYSLNSNKEVSGMNFNDKNIIFDRDSKGRLVSLRTEDEIFYYKLNLFSDVEALLDSEGNEVIKCTYDSWGKIISIEGSEKEKLEKLNPFKYRSYFFDNETGFYYLQSRYYNPEINRFINMDDRLIENGNVYSYCNNNPIVMVDYDGHLGHYMCGWAYPTRPSEVALVERRWKQYVSADAVNKYGTKLVNMYRNDFSKPRTYYFSTGSITVRGVFTETIPQYKIEISPIPITLGAILNVPFSPIIDLITGVGLGAAMKN
ncbi:hypothetical protein AZF37_08650 [endosymbiont 'TC1' of Trimyema compressum]|uniref:RHS repeat domain-containing protein n=1 Tax=endosymbiont 'TC1' of Trimyema compressum TaxID=243899 RepID=UPI0007F0B9C6|nr:RHS repeat-associated core domain-containing protein [endosymbiont 'TC1' of Trimyema compressum]AMP21214.1 hypothetical protein AZF37_08650 [endosymbiont 'TC1' of Trimyema compressum]